MTHRDLLSSPKKFLTPQVRHKHIREDGHTIQHAEVDIEGSIIMFAQSTDEYPAKPGYLFTYVEDADESYKKAVENGATTVNEPSDQPYGRSCGIKDPNENTWWITSVAKKG